MRAVFCVLITLVLALALACAPPPEEPEPRADDVATDAETKTDDDAPNLAWPPALQASGPTTQNATSPICNTSSSDASTGTPVVIPASQATIYYDWDAKTMHTHFEPHCPALLTLVSGSEYPCDYYFVSDDAESQTNGLIYYVYQNQNMGVEGDPDPYNQKCCSFEQISMLGPNFPNYVEQYNAHCNVTSPPSPHRVPDSAVVLATPGNVGSFYAYDSTGLLPDGFGGCTANGAFTNLEYSQVTPGAVPAMEVPAICKDAPPCKNCFPDGKCGRDLSAFFENFKKTENGACVLCHNRFEDTRFPRAYPACPPTDADAAGETIARSW